VVFGVLILSNYGIVSIRTKDKNGKDKTQKESAS
jgi:hypothetical protein